MPAGVADSLLTTLYADVHYYFSPPAIKPLRHRFDRGSYVYLFRNSGSSSLKLEIANHAGTSDQDAFYGYLDVVDIQHSHLQPALVSIHIDPSAVLDESTWHLRDHERAQQASGLSKLHALDIYLWTEKDALAFLTHLKNNLNPGPLEASSAPDTRVQRAEHQVSMSPVVEQLERTAIGSRFQQTETGGVPTQYNPHSSTQPPLGSGSPESVQAVPSAYNPAAPGAPERVMYREKTPPPHDADFTPKHMLINDHAGQYQPQTYPAIAPSHLHSSPQVSNSPHQTPSNLPGPPSTMPPPPQQQRTPSFGPMAPSTLPQPPPSQQQPNLRSSISSGSTGQGQFGTYDPQNAAAMGATTYSSHLPPALSAAPAYAGQSSTHSSAGPLSPPLQQQQQPPFGGYSGYDYTGEPAQSSTNPYGPYTGDVHQQAYRPTEAEHGAHFAKPKRSNTAAVDGKPFGNLEGKVGKYLNKLDKLW